MWQAMAAQWMQDQPEAGYGVMLCVCVSVVRPRSEKQKTDHRWPFVSCSCCGPDMALTVRSQVEVTNSTW